MWISYINPEQLLAVENVGLQQPNQLATQLLRLLFTEEEISTQNVTKPVRKDIKRMDHIKIIWQFEVIILLCCCVYMLIHCLCISSLPIYHVINF